MHVIKAIRGGDWAKPDDNSYTYIYTHYILCTFTRTTGGGAFCRIANGSYIIILSSILFYVYVGSTVHDSIKYFAHDLLRSDVKLKVQSTRLCVCTRIISLYTRVARIITLAWSISPRRGGKKETFLFFKCNGYKYTMILLEYTIICKLRRMCWLGALVSPICRSSWMPRPIIITIWRVKKKKKNPDSFSRLILLKW